RRDRTVLRVGNQLVEDSPQPPEGAAGGRAVGEQAVDLGPGLVGSRGGRLGAEPPTQEGFRHLGCLSSVAARPPPRPTGAAPTRATTPRAATPPGSPA